MSPLDMDYPEELIPVEEDTLDVPKHVLRFDELLIRYNDGKEPINSWRTQDVASAFQCLWQELTDRGYNATGYDAPVTPENTDDGI